MSLFHVMGMGLTRTGIHCEGWDNFQCARQWVNVSIADGNMGQRLLAEAFLRCDFVIWHEQHAWVLPHFHVGV